MNLLQQLIKNNKKTFLYLTASLSMTAHPVFADSFSDQIQKNSTSSIFSNVYAGGDTLISRNNYNGRALNLLQWRENEDVDSPYFVLGGTFEERMAYGHNAAYIFKSAGNSGYAKNGNSTGFYLRKASIDVMAAVNDDLTLETGYDANINHIRTLSAIIGNLKKSPWYGQVGTFYPNFGIFLPIDFYNYNMMKFYFRPDPTTAGGFTYYNQGFRFSFTEFCWLIAVMFRNQVL